MTDHRELEQKLESAMQRLAQCDQTLSLCVETEKATRSALQEVQKRIDVLERSALTRRMFDDVAATSKIYPKSKTVIFVGREYIGDNIKYAYLAFCEQARSHGVACYFLPADDRQCRQLTAAGLPCLPWALSEWTDESMRLLLQAKVAVLYGNFYPSDERGQLCHALLRGAKTIQLWHGIPLKQIGLECLYSPATFSERAASLLAAAGPFDVFVGTSAAMEPDWARRFAFAEYAPVGYPRTDVLRRAPAPHDGLNVDEESLKLAEMSVAAEKPVILYAPTFRDRNLGAWFETSGMERFEAYCRAQGYTLLVNLHPFEHEWQRGWRQRYPHIRFLAPQTDIYPILKHVSLLITDYSSLVFDFLLLDRPVIFYRHDHADYVSQSRALIDGHDDYLCGDTATTLDALEAATATALRRAKTGGEDPHRSLRQDMRRRLYDHDDGRASQRVADLIMKHVADSP